MPLTKAPATKPAAAVAKKPTPSSAATNPSALKNYMGAYYPYAFTDEYSKKKTHRIDLVVYLPGHVKPGETPTVRIIDSTTVHIYSQFNKNILGENLPIVLGLSEESARYQAYCSIGQGLASSKQYENDADRELLTGEPHRIPLLVKVKLMDPEVTVHPYENGMQRRSTNGRHIYKQFSSVLIVRLEVDKPWKEVGGRIKTGGAINLLGFGSQSSAEDSPQKKRSWGGGGGRRGGSKRSKLNSVEEDEEEEEEDDAGDKEYWSYYIFMSYKIATYVISHNSLNLNRICS
jgi:hypothetical protein